MLLPHLRLRSPDNAPQPPALKRLWHPADRDRAETTIDTALNEQRGFEMDVRIIRPDGSLRFLRCLGQPVVSATGAMDDAAERTLDVQYHIWHHDVSGTLLAEALRPAADGGVRVGLLLNDNNTAGLDTILAGRALGSGSGVWWRS